MMNEKKDLRRILDELRKLACDINEEEIRSHSVITLNQGRYNRQFRLDMNHDWLNAWHAELERIIQVIEAMLGRGECRFVTVVDQDPSRRHRGNIAECDCCGYRCAIGFIQDERFRYCPNCGAKVVDE